MQSATGAGFEPTPSSSKPEILTIRRPGIITKKVDAQKGFEPLASGLEGPHVFHYTTVHYYVLISIHSLRRFTKRLYFTH